MKYLLVFSVVLVAVWVWRNNRQGSRPDAERPAPRRPAPPAAMVACSQCGTHVPETEAVSGQHGRYCCPEHRRQAES